MSFILTIKWIIEEVRQNESSSVKPTELHLINILKKHIFNSSKNIK